MEENLNNEDNNEESKEYYFSSKNPLTKYCFVFMEYIRSINPELYEKATEYASDHVGITITDFDIEDLDEDLEELEGDLEDIFEEIDEQSEDEDDYHGGYDDDEQQ